ncbi:hypothetical protein [Microseira sp. BLCC-F43]|uniref:hypothetical protein n=1 Tax=Microseira sp. BLCC-F43 TaxID=3153602 RepID=UPI0035B83455
MLSSTVLQTVVKMLNARVQVIGLIAADGEKFKVFALVHADSFMSSILEDDESNKTQNPRKKLNNISQGLTRVKKLLIHLV